MTENHQNNGLDYSCTEPAECDPFGMPMPGRNYTSGEGYRFGFNGKETDKEYGAGGGTQDYGFRMYSPAVGRFLSQDPLFKSYPGLTTYQFASNRPIDGIDLDGLEYFTFHILVNENGEPKLDRVTDHRAMSDADIQEIHGMSSSEFYKEYAQSFGEMGRGARYIYYYPDGSIDASPKNFEWQQSASLTNEKIVNALINKDFSDIGIHGSFYGSGAITNFGNKYGHPKDYNFDPSFLIDGVDQLALAHDNIDNYQGWLEETRALNSDIIFRDGLKEYLKQNVDPITGRKLSKESKLAAKNAIRFFNQVIKYKEWKISATNAYINYVDPSIEGDAYDPKNMEIYTLDDYREAGGDKLDVLKKARDE